MAVLVFYSDAADGFISSNNASYDPARSGSGSTLTADTTNTTATVGQYYYSSYYCYEAFISFDTSALPDSVTPSSAILNLYGFQDNSTNADFTFEARVYDWGTTLTTGDYVAGASLSALTSVATLSTASGWTTSGYNNLTDVALPANINKTGTTRLICCSSRQTNNTAAVGFESVSFYTTDETGTTKDPTITVTITTPVVSIKKISGVNRDQVKKLSGLVNA